MAARNLRPASAASSSRSISRSSRNFRNMIQVSNGRRSRSPFSPLSLRMISRADFSKLPSDCAVVGCGTILRVAADLGGIEMSLQFVYGLAQLIDASKEADDVTDLAMV